jgi:hypothetical protein
MSQKATKGLTVITWHRLRSDGDRLTTCHVRYSTQLSNFGKTWVSRSNIWDASATDDKAWVLGMYVCKNLFLCTVPMYVAMCYTVTINLYVSLVMLYPLSSIMIFWSSNNKYRFLFRIIMWIAFHLMEFFCIICILFSYNLLMRHLN